MDSSTNANELQYATILKELHSTDLFHKSFFKKRELGHGADGIVASYSHRIHGFEIAVKTPLKRDHALAMAIAKEVYNLKALGSHPNIVSMLSYNKDFQPIGPAIFFPLCDLGDLTDYYYSWAKQQITRKASPRVPEVTLLKLMRDMSLALDFLHNGHDTCYVHGDLKPENILVVTPRDWPDGEIPTEPIFKLADMGRLTSYPASDWDEKAWRGTYAFAPPSAECTGAQKPAVDIWGLGATIQSFALNITPQASRAAVIRERVAQGKMVPDIKDDKLWYSDYWLSRMHVMYRPINATTEVLLWEWDVEEKEQKHLVFHTPFSDLVNLYYKMLLDKDPETRITSAHLVKYVVPLIEQRILVERKLLDVMNAFGEARELRASVSDGISVASKDAGWVVL